MQTSFYNYKRYRWFWFCALLVATLTVIYIWDKPIGGRSGGSTLGYSYGVIATIGILILMLYAARKRTYGANIGTLQGWLSCHVWLGVSLLVIVPLHCAFSFGVNVHTLAYVLMAVTIITGIWGAMNYAVLSKQIESHRGGGKAVAILEQVSLLSKEVEKLAAKQSDAVLKIVHQLDYVFKPGLKNLFGFGKPKRIHQAETAKLLVHVPDGERGEALKIIQLIDQKSDLLERMLDEARIKTILRSWLFLHVPISVGLCVALAIHIFSVFYYR